jgi:WD40 repeat protein
MSKIRWFRWLAWAAFASVLIVLGVGIYQAQPHQPRWETKQISSMPEEHFVSVHDVRFSSDGAKVITVSVSEERNAFALLANVTFGTVDLWDRNTGKATRYPNSKIFCSRPALSKNLRYCIGLTRNRAREGDDWNYSITVCDLDEEREISIPLQESPGHCTLAFAPTSDCFVFYPDGDVKPRSLRIYESATGKLLDRRQSFGPLGSDPFSDDCLIHLVLANHTAVELWSLPRRKAVGTLSKPGWDFKQLSSDGRALVLSNPQNADGPVGRWDIESRQFTSGPATKYLCSPRLSPDGKWAADPYLDGDRFHICEVASGESKGSAELVAHEDWPLFSPDSRFLIVPCLETAGNPMMADLRTPPGPMDALSVYSVPSMELLWKSSWGDTCPAIGFSQDGNTIFAAFGSENPIRLFDAATGDPRGKIDLPGTKGYTGIWSTADRRYLLIHRPDDGAGPPQKLSLPERIFDWISSCLLPADRTRDTIIVYDTVTNSERFRLTGWRCEGLWLSDDGATLITSQLLPGNAMQCWDVGWKPLHWAVGIPVAIGGVVVALLSGYRRLRRKPAPVDVTRSEPRP